jgi:hypothetical protein
MRLVPLGNPILSRWAKNPFLMRTVARSLQRDKALLAVNFTHHNVDAPKDYHGICYLVADHESA